VVFARGFAHIGILKTLLAHGLRLEVITGTSIGALIGGCCAAGQLKAAEEWALAPIGPHAFAEAVNVPSRLRRRTIRQFPRYHGVEQLLVMLIVILLAEEPVWVQT
jgi:predicted acylesterase/phospholipase RssA